jgi:TonB-linked SusC/RagA family outer membrane protein
MKKNLLFFTLCMFFFWNVAAQTNPVKGIVRSATDSDPLIGVNITVKGSAAGTITDADGAFVIYVQPSDVLVFSYIGYRTQEVVAGNQTSLQISLMEDNRFLDEIVVIGYGVQRKSVVSASIARVTSEDLDMTIPSRVENVLKGKVAGVTIMQTSGQPGAESHVRVRGIGSVNSKDPLYIVDGIAIDGSISYLNPNDIASVEVLKDAASAAIYGTRGANGVILITTKSGEKGKVVINYDFSYGWQNPWKKKAVLDAKEYMTLMNEMAINDETTPKFSIDQIANAKTTNWQEEVFNYNAPVQNHSISMSGATETNNYFFSFGYFNQEGTVGGNVGKSNQKRYNVRLNDTQTAFETKTRNFLNKIKVGVNFGYTHGENTGVETNSEFGSILGSALAFVPYVPVYAEDPDAILAEHPYSVKDNQGKVFSTPPSGFQEIANPVAMLYQPSRQLNMEDVFVGAVWGELNILDNLKFRSSYSIDMSFYGNEGYNFPYFLAIQGKDLSPENANIFAEKNRRFSWQAENYLSYDQTFADKHNVQVVVGQSAFKSSMSHLWGSRVQPNSYDPSMSYLDNTPESWKDARVNGNTGSVDFHALASYFGRVNYNFDERYIFSASLRKDGSSRFGANRKWGYFPAVSFAWNILNEPYITKPAGIDAAKLRFSWGRNGNENIGNLRYASYDERGAAHNYYFGGTYGLADGGWSGELVSGTTPGALPNPYLHWEQSDQTDVGLDLRFLGNALTFTVDYYTKTTIGMLMDQIIPSYLGASPPVGNVGTMKNSGVEFELGWKNHIGKFSYFVNANASLLKNKLVEYGNASGIQSNIAVQGNTGVGEYQRASNGEVYPYFWGLKTDGIFQNWDEIHNYTYTYIDEKTGAEVTEMIQPLAKPGDVRFVDLNNDGKITDNDKMKIGKPLPDWTFGFTIGGEWNGIDASLFFQGTYGNDIFEYAQRSDIPSMNRPEWILQRWHGEGTSNVIPRLTSANDNQNWRSSDLFIKDGSYLRLKNAQIGYTLPATITQKAAIRKIRFFIAAENLLTFTKYKGFDVEMGESGIDRGIYPQSRTVSLGANIIF